MKKLFELTVCQNDDIEMGQTCSGEILVSPTGDGAFSGELLQGKVVPAGMGDGQMAEILKKMLSEGYRGFLSLEPHLGDFDGFHLLEQSDQKTPMDGKRKLTGEEAFTLAHDSLIKLLETIA